MNISGETSRRFNSRALRIVDMDKPFGIKLKKMYSADDNEIVMNQGMADFEMSKLLRNTFRDYYKSVNKIIFNQDNSRFALIWITIVKDVKLSYYEDHDLQINHEYEQESDDPNILKEQQ